MSFEAASFVFDDPRRLEREDVFARGEYRSIVIGQVDGLVLTVVYAVPEDGLVASSPRALPQPTNAKLMSKTSFTRKRGASFRFADKDRKRLKAVSDAKAEALAVADADNPPLSEQQLRRMALAREVRLVREKTGLSQPQFAARFHIGLARLRDFEQARSEPDFVVRVFLRMIQEDPGKAERLVKLVERDSATMAL